MFTRLLNSARNRVVASGFMLSLIEPLVEKYRRALAAYGPSTTTLSISGLSSEFYTKSYQEVRHFYPIFSERDELADLLRELQPNDVFFDVGAHIGIYSCFASQILTDGEVIAFEPHPLNVNRLEENLDLNNIDANIQSVALANESNIIDISIDGRSPGAMAHLAEDKRDETISVDVVHGHNYLSENEIPDPDVMKIDVEGAELKVLKGLEKSLGDCRIIYCEVSDQLQDYDGSERELIDFLRQKGFDIEYLSKNNVTHGDLKATKR